MCYYSIVSQIIMRIINVYVDVNNYQTGSATIYQNLGHEKMMSVFINSTISIRVVCALTSCQA